MGSQRGSLSKSLIICECNWTAAEVVGQAFGIQHASVCCERRTPAAPQTLLGRHCIVKVPERDAQGKDEQWNWQQMAQILQIKEEKQSRYQLKSPGTTINTDVNRFVVLVFLYKV